MLQEIVELQKSAVAKLISIVKNERKDSYTFRAPTGSGKTYMMADFMNQMLETNSGVIFLVSSLSKSDLAKQNYDKFCEYRDKNYFKNLNPYLINSEIAGEERCIVSDIAGTTRDATDTVIENAHGKFTFIDKIFKNE